MKESSSIHQMMQSYQASDSSTDQLREIFQQTALLGLARHHFFEHAVFYGATALRITHGLDRYSEGLDFSLKISSPNFSFSSFIQGLNRELESIGFSLKVSSKDEKKQSSFQSAFLKTSTICLVLLIEPLSKNYSLNLEQINLKQNIQLKLEVDTSPPLTHLPFEVKLVLNPIPFYINAYALPDLMAGKIHSALCRNWKGRVKGRDWYDLLWYIQRKTPVHLAHLEERLRQTEGLRENDLDKKELLEFLHHKIDRIDWIAAKVDIAPFIIEPARLNLWSTSFFHDYIEQIEVLD
jgi:predicted nucleotidyltransferase component of viral defense system